MSDGTALLMLGDLDDPEALHPNLERFGDAYRMSLFVPMPALAADPEKVLRFLEAQLGELLDLHGDERGVFVYPEGSWQAATYDALVDEVGAAGFWARPDEVAPPTELPPGARGQELQALTEQAMAAVVRTRPGSSVPATPAAPAGMLQAADRYDAVAAELEVAVKHLRRAAEHYRTRDVPRAAAHRLAADGHLVRSRQELDALAVLHAEKSRT